MSMILAPLRGVTVRCFRETFGEVIRESGFDEAITPFIPAMPGVDPLKSPELRLRHGECEGGSPCPAASADLDLNAQSTSRDGTSRRALPVSSVLGTAFGSVDSGVSLSTPHSPSLRVTPQFIGKDPEALRHCLERTRAAGCETADLNCGCPFPMVRNKGRGSGILRTPDVLRKMLEVGCEVMGEGRFSIKARLGVDRNDELLGLIPMINEFPLRFLTVHARNARQMYEGNCDMAALEKIRRVAKVPIVLNGDIPFPCPPNGPAERLMVGRAFIRHLGTRDDIHDLLRRYVAASQAELCGDRPVLGRMKELLAYWKDLPQWSRRWNVIKVCRTVAELPF